jgi:transcriptional regulator with XRE-family HTH domain
MSDRQKILSRLIADRDFRADYIRAKLDVLIPSQLRALRVRENKTQPELAQMANMKQSRISAMETPGLVNFNRETLVRMAATHGIGMIIKFVSFSEMLEWENGYSQDEFRVTHLSEDINFLQPGTPRIRIGNRVGRRRKVVTRSMLPVQMLESGSTGLNAQTVSSQRPVQMQLNFEQSSGARKPYEVFKQSSATGCVSNPPPNIAATGIAATRGLSNAA